MIESLRTLKRLPEAVCLALYSLLLAFAVAHHEPWADEAQAWQIARSLSPWQILHTYLHYEGSPGLWHLFLWALIHLGVTYSGMHWVCGLIAAAGVAILIFRAPFPLYLRLLLPFTYFLIFQFAVVARSYVLVPVLLFCTLLCWKRNPVVLAALLGLMANLAAHATIVAVAIALLYLLDDGLIKGWTRKQLGLACALLFAACAFALWTAWPARDVVIASYHPAASTAVHTSFVADFVAGAFYTLLVPFFEPFWLSLPFWAIVIAVLLHAKCFRYMAPIALFAACGGALHTGFWHVGLMSLLLLAVLWIVWDQIPRDWSRHLLQAALLSSILVQIGWSAYAINFDRRYAYSPDLEAARFLAPYVLRGDRIASTSAQDVGVQDFHSVGLEPYFHENLFINQQMPFWWWSSNNRSESDFRDALQSAPPIVVVDFYSPARFDPARDIPGGKNQLLTVNGYRLARAFCGSIPQGFTLHADMCHLIYIHSGVGSPGSAQLPAHP